MGLLRHEIRHLHQPSVSPSSQTSTTTTTMSSSTISALAAQLKNASPLSSPCSVVVGHSGNGKELLPGNESMDSGVAGLRDGMTTSPHGGSPASITTATTTTSSSTVAAMTGPVAIANSVLPLQYQQQHHHSLQQQQQHYLYPVLPVSDEVLQQQQYIIDRNSRTTYLKGKFLGKVIYIFFLNK